MKKVRIMVLALMVMALMAGLLPWAAVPARAEDAIVLRNGAGSVTLESGKTYTWEGDSDVTVGKITVSGNATLQAGNSALNVTGYITVNAGATLTIKGSESSTPQINANIQGNGTVVFPAAKRRSTPALPTPLSAARSSSTAAS